MLQLPPEAWLRLSTFNCSLTILTIRPSGSVRCTARPASGYHSQSHALLPAVVALMLAAADACAAPCCSSALDQHI